MKFLKTTWHHVRRSPYQTLAAIFIMLQTFFVISIFAFLIFASAKTINYFESLPKVTVFFKNEAKQENIDALKDQIQASGKVSEIKFVSKQEALKIYTEQNKDDPMLLELVTADVLPASLEISATKIDDLSIISDMLENNQFIERVILPKDIVASLKDWTSALRKIGAGLIVILSFDSIFIMVIIIGIRISQKKDEIEIMRLLGATNWYIRWPFIYEGIFYGVIGAFFGWIISSAAILYVSPFLASFLRDIPLLPLSPIFLLELLGVEILIAIFLGMFSSFLAVLRYLK
ncbi:MAG: permease-like cell division protein FtsX [Candidatus Levybacteria bacterium]|nr:permease-like cell division protein FtsX [Candidatus Levybacteria bacterium]